MPFPYARFFPACFLAITKARMRGKPFPAYSTWPFVTLPIISHRFLLFQTEKTMGDNRKRWRNRWVSKPLPSWLRKTGREGPFPGGGWVHSFMVVAFRRSSHERTPQTVYAQLLIGILFPVGSLNLLQYKTKPIVRWGRKATGLNLPP